jgi:hypothetical protein
MIFVPFVAGTVTLLIILAFGQLSAPTPPSTGCISNIANPPQTQYNSTLARIEHDPGFVSATGGLCYSFASAYEVGGSGVWELHLVFDHETPHVIYPCGRFGVHQIDHRLEVLPQTNANGTIVGFRYTFVGFSNMWSCPREVGGLVPVVLQATNDTVSSQELVSVTLENGGPPITSLAVEITLPSGTYTQAFTSVSDSAPLGSGQQATQTVTLPLGAMKTWTSYTMIETGLAQGEGGGPFNWTLSVQLEG